MLPFIIHFLLSSSHRSSMGCNDHPINTIQKKSFSFFPSIVPFPSSSIYFYLSFHPSCPSILRSFLSSRLFFLFILLFLPLIQPSFIFLLPSLLPRFISYHVSSFTLYFLPTFLFFLLSFLLSFLFCCPSFFYPLFPFILPSLVSFQSSSPSILSFPSLQSLFPTILSFRSILLFLPSFLSLHSSFPSKPTSLSFFLLYLLSFPITTCTIPATSFGEN